MNPMKVGYLAVVLSRSLSSIQIFSPWLVKTSGIFRVHTSVGKIRYSQTKTEEPFVIRIPRYMQKQIEDVKQLRGKNKIKTITAGKLLIQSKNPQLNQSAGYILGKFEQPCLSSKGWKHNKSFGDYFAINNTKSVAPFVTENEQQENVEDRKTVTFCNLKICKELVDVLNNMNIIYPTTVQLRTIPKVLKGENILCAAETGSGKTLSYLLPIVHRLQAQKETEDITETARKISSVILVPSRELADQVAAVSRTLCAPFGMLTKTVGGGQGVGQIKMVFKGSPPDILVATPGALVKALKRNYLNLNDLNFLVIDEADTMFDPSFSALLENILSYVHVASHPSETRGLGRKAQLLMVGATFPGGVGEVLSQITDLGSIFTLKSKMLHFLMPHVKQTFLKIRGADKILELHEALKLHQQEKQGTGVLVFCNKAPTVNWLGFSLEELGIQHLRLQGEMPAAVRAGIFRSFQKGKVDVLVCTDIASRGLDTSRVHLVVNYDFPESQTDYIHRAGRVGRAGSVEGGKVLSFVTHPWDVELVQKIETAARRSASLPGMESAIHEPKPKSTELEE